MSEFRTPDTGRIDRGKRLRFWFDRTRYDGFEGDTLASALLANGVHLMGRSFKYHRPRGVMSAGSDEPNALVSVGVHARHTPNLRATQVELHADLEAFSQNRFPSLALDLGALAGLGGAMLGAGFYYKIFMGPGRAWHRVYEPLIRRAAGLGRAPEQADPDVYTQRYAFCDVLVVGAGAAGIAAALAASEGGARVLLVDEQAECGGWLLSENFARIDGVSASEWLARSMAMLAARPNVTVLSRTTAFGYFAQNFVGLCERLTDHLTHKPKGRARERLWKVRAGRVVLATGAIEQPLVFGGNDRPGVMLASAARTYVNRYGVRPGSRCVMFTSDDSAYAAARDLMRAGVVIEAIADLRAAAGCDTSGLPVRFRTVVADTIGYLRVAGADLVSADGALERVGCDLVLMAGGFVPALHLHSQSRGKLVFDAARGIFLPGETAQDMTSVGACRGVSGVEACLADGFGAAGVRVSGEIVPSGHYSGVVPGTRVANAFVDFQNDVKAKDIRLAVQEGFHAIEHVKRYTTTGMATDQGRTSNMNALAIAAEALARPLPAVGLTTFRMPTTPVTFGSFAGLSRGELFDPVRHTPMHAWAEVLGAVFEDIGQWKRANHFPRPGESKAQAVARECLAVRNGVGIFDGSTLGKIEIVGPDAAEFLNRIYVNSWTRLSPGRCRYGVMLNEAGFIIDDGVIARLAPDRFHVTTTTSGAAQVLSHMEDYLQTEFFDLSCALVSVTEQYAVITVQGPRARDVIAPLVAGVDLQKFPHMSVAECEVAGIPARLFRVSFTGEAGYEINVPAGHGQAVWDAVWAAGQAFGITPYGLEAMHVLRAEKGYIVVGQDTDGTCTPDDMGLGWAVGKAKPDFVGKRSLRRPDIVAPGRMQMVGLLTQTPGYVPEEGTQITPAAKAPPGTAAIGHVTSSYHSATLGRSLVLAMLENGRARHGERVFLQIPEGVAFATVCDPVFYDRAGVRLDG